MADPLKVLMVDASPFGGIAHYTHHLAEALSGHGVTVHLAGAARHELAAWDKHYTAHYFLDREGWYPGNLWRLRRLVRRIEPDLIHFQTLFSPRRDALFLSWATAGRPWILTVHNVLPHDEWERQARGLPAALRRLYHRAGRLIVLAQHCKGQLVNDLALPADRIAVIPHGCYQFVPPVEGSASQAKEHLGLSPRDEVILCFGALRPYKGIEVLIDAFAQLHERRPEARLLLVGLPMGQTGAYYHRLLEARQLTSVSVLIARYVPLEEVPRYFGAADVAVFPYLAISQSAALLLAYAYAKPVVATRVGAFPETVADGENGVLVPPRDAAALAAALESILAKPEAERARMGARSEQLARERYDWGDIARQTTQVYRQTLSS